MDKIKFINPRLIGLALDERQDLDSHQRDRAFGSSVTSASFTGGLEGHLGFSVTRLLACPLPWPWRILPDLLGTDVCS